MHGRLRRVRTCSWTLARWRRVLAVRAHPDCGGLGAERPGESAQAWDRVSSADNPEAYVRKILVREYLGWRRLKNTSEVPTDTPHLLHGHASDGNTAIDRVGETDAMWQLLAHLPRQQRAALVMRYYLDLPDDEIAPHLGCSAATVRSHLSRGLKTLRSITPATPDKGSHR